MQTSQTRKLFVTHTHESTHGVSPCLNEVLYKHSHRPMWRRRHVHRSGRWTNFATAARQFCSTGHDWEGETVKSGVRKFQVQPPKMTVRVAVKYVILCIGASRSYSDFFSKRLRMHLGFQSLDSIFANDFSAFQCRISSCGRRGSVASHCCLGGPSSVDSKSVKLWAPGLRAGTIRKDTLTRAILLVLLLVLPEPDAMTHQERWLLQAGGNLKGTHGFRLSATLLRKQMGILPSITYNSIIYIVLLSRGMRGLCFVLKESVHHAPLFCACRFCLSQGSCWIHT